MMSSVPPPETFAMEHHLAAPPAAEQERLCYVHCEVCDTILAVDVPCSSLFKTVTVGCGYCANLLSVDLRALLLPPAAGGPLAFGQALLSPTSPHGLQLDEAAAFKAPSLLSAEQASAISVSTTTSSDSSCGNSASAMLMAPPPAKPPAAREPAPPKNATAGTRSGEKRQRVPSAYNRFIKDEIQRIKACYPDITHREAFSAAAKNWAHFPHIHFGLMPDQGLKNNTIQNQDGGESMLFKDGLYAAAAAAAASSMGIAPF
ncbi:hypothetical protein ACP70R_011243 [Stipagrostis hirtigluma subsp. patula]